MCPAIVDPLLTCKLLLVTSHLPLTDFYRFISYLDHSVIELRSCCRFLKVRIEHHPALWRHIYTRNFLNGSQRVEEWDFVYWCARSYLPVDDMPLQSSILLHMLDWHDVYRRRVTTEQNWRLGHSRSITARLPCEQSYNYPDTRKSVSTAFSFPTENDDTDASDSYGEVRETLVMVETGTFTSLDRKRRKRSASVNTTELMPSITSLDIRSQFGNAITMLSDRFLVAIFSYIDRTELKVYTRGDYKLRYTANLPSGYNRRSINGQWALFMQQDDQSELTNSRILVWDLERIKGHTKKLAATSYAACLYETTHEYATIYVARINEHQRNQVDWSLYQVRHDTPIRRLQKGSFNVDVPLRSLSITAQEYPHIKLYVSTSHHGCIRYIHTVTLNKDLTIERDRVQRLAHQVVSIPNSYDGTNKIFYRLLEEQEGELVFNSKFDWSTICQYRHIIGSLFVIQQWKDDHRHYYLVDVKTGEIIRRIDGNEACCMPHFLMTGYIIRDCRTSNAKITSYAAL